VRYGSRGLDKKRKGQKTETFDDEIGRSSQIKGLGRSRDHGKSKKRRDSKTKAAVTRPRNERWGGGGGAGLKRTEVSDSFPLSSVSVGRQRNEITGGMQRRRRPPKNQIRRTPTWGVRGKKDPKKSNPPSLRAAVEQGKRRAMGSHPTSRAIAKKKKNNDREVTAGGIAVPLSGKRRGHKGRRRSAGVRPRPCLGKTRERNARSRNMKGLGGKASYMRNRRQKAKATRVLAAHETTKGVNL